MVSITSAPPNPTTNTTANFNYAVNTALATVACKLDTAVVACGAASASLPVTTGPHTFQVSATNITGTATDSYSWTMIPLPPTVSITSGPTSGTTSTSANFEWTLGGGPTTAVASKLDGGAVPCATLTTAAVSGVSTDADGVVHTFQVTASNANPTTAKATRTAGL